MLDGLRTLSSGNSWKLLLKYIPSSESQWKETQVISEVSETVHDFKTSIK